MCYVRVHDKLLVLVIIACGPTSRAKVKVRVGNRSRLEIGSF